MSSPTIEKIYNGGEDINDEMYDQNSNNSRKTYKWLGALTAGVLVAGIAAAGTYAWVSKEAKTEAENSLNEGLLRSRGFDENSIVIDITGHTDVITIDCPGTDQSQVSFMFDPGTMLASWNVAPQEDQRGQVVETFSPIVFPLGTETEVIDFIDEDLVRACNAIESN